VTSRRSTAGHEGLRVVDLSPDPASAASRSKNAQGVLAAVHELTARSGP
jgi:hypothetical protein